MLSIVINYCSNESIFIRPLLQQCTILQDRELKVKVIVSVGSHLYDMSPESQTHIMELQNEFPCVDFVWYQVTESCPMYPMNPLRQRPKAYWHNVARMKGYGHILPSSWILFLDADEIPDATLFGEWIDHVLPNVQQDVAMKLANYWYFRKPVYQATTYEDSPVLIHSSRIKNQDALMTDNERDGIIVATNTPCVRCVVHPNGKKPMIHHFSWVRTHDQLIKKVQMWGHQNDENWETLVQREMAQPFSGKDFVHGYEYVEVPNFFVINC
jgi:hypothetical protein